MDGRKGIKEGKGMIRGKLMANEYQGFRSLFHLYTPLLKPHYQLRPYIHCDITITMTIATIKTYTELIIQSLLSIFSFG